MIRLATYCACGFLMAIAVLVAAGFVFAFMQKLGVPATNDIGPYTAFMFGVLLCGLVGLLALLYFAR